MEELPFYSFWQECKAANQGKTIHLILGLGTSGSVDAKDIRKYMEKKKSQDSKAVFFILLIDSEYERVNPRKTSMTPFLEQLENARNNNIQAETTELRFNRNETRMMEENLYNESWGMNTSNGEASQGAASDAAANNHNGSRDFTTNVDASEDQRYIKAKDGRGNYLYLWGTMIPTAYDNMAKYSELRNHAGGPYEYGKSCTIKQEPEATRNFYTQLKPFFEVAELNNIYVYNQAHYITTAPDYTYSINARTRYYTGPSFTHSPRIVKVDNIRSQIPRGSRIPSAHIINFGVYFESFCELLYCLYESRKPIYILNLQEDNLQEKRIYERGPQQGGRSRRKTKKGRKSKRSQSRRRRTV